MAGGAGFLPSTVGQNVSTWLFLLNMCHAQNVLRLAEEVHVPYLLPAECTWRIIPFSKSLITMVILSPLSSVPLPNGLLMAYKWQLITTYTPENVPMEPETAPKRNRKRIGTKPPISGFHINLPGCTLTGISPPSTPRHGIMCAFSTPPRSKRSQAVKGAHAACRTWFRVRQLNQTKKQEANIEIIWKKKHQLYDSNSNRLWFV